MTDKALRRFQQKNAKLRSMRRLRWNGGSSPEFLSPRVIGIHAKTPRLCSCGACANPRRLLGAVTRQERLAAFDG